MEQKQNKYISVSYELFTYDENQGKHLEEKTQPGNPFTFISGFGVSLDGFEKRIVDLEAGQLFDFDLEPAEAFGDYDPEGVHNLKRDVFTINGHFDHDNIFEGAIITMLDAEERRFMASVLEITDEHVTIDTNHPLAGKTLHFTGKVEENRDATNDELQQMLKRLSGGGCGCGCDDCDDCHHDEHGHHHEGHDHHCHDCGCEHHHH